MHSEPFDLGAGSVHVLESASDWHELAPSLRRIVAPTLRGAFADFPASFSERARRAHHAGLRRFLTAAAQGSCRLRVYDTEDFGRHAMLEVLAPQACLCDFRDFGTRTRRFPPSASERDRPKRVPTALTETYRAVGGIQFQLGASGSLIPPDALMPLPRHWQSSPALDVGPVDAAELLDNIREALQGMRSSFREAGVDASHMTDEWLEEQARAQTQNVADALSNPAQHSFRLDDWLAGCPGAPTPKQAERLFPFFEDSGNYLCFDSRGQATWIGWETGGVMPFGNVAGALDAFFDSILSGKPFTAAFRPVA